MSDADRHLDARSWKALQDRSPDAVAYFADHLSRDCELCEAFLARTGEEEDSFGLEAMTDETLGALGPLREDAVGWARLRRRMGPPRRAWLTGAVAVAVAASVAFALRPLAPAGEQADTSWQLKGGAGLSLEVTAVARLPDGSLQAVAEDTALPAEAVVLVRYRSNEVADALLALEAPGAPPQMLGSYTLESGTHDLREGGELVGVSLEGEHGPRTLVLVAWPRSPHSLAARDAALARGQVPEDALQARLRLQVMPGYHR
ncbi:hypothetical protein LZ198_00125 [Myxococcus sp. K15C18031901]|uniref:hypothetical protein n=1 Tax=Myxococcus dinghuensis TaxID=2906761 RepID=UPI0020A78353|nr:hypothetical protein [Myxococcus dinghuensis]MCP3097271.1 hypothetical protein [Myxococcus dinghuensis]